MTDALIVLACGALGGAVAYFCILAFGRAWDAAMIVAEIERMDRAALVALPAADGERA